MAKYKTPYKAVIFRRAEDENTCAIITWNGIGEEVPATPAELFTAISDVLQVLARAKYGPVCDLKKSNRGDINVGDLADVFLPDKEFEKLLKSKWGVFALKIETHCTDGIVPWDYDDNLLSETYG